MCADRDWIAKRTAKETAEFQVADPKAAFESALAITARDRKENEIAELVQDAPLRNWLANRSFEDFYDNLWQKSKEHNCRIENLRERQ